MHKETWKQVVRKKNWKILLQGLLALALLYVAALAAIAFMPIDPAAAQHNRLEQANQSALAFASKPASTPYAQTHTTPATAASTPTDSNTAKCPNHTVELPLKRNFTIAAGQTQDIGTVDVSCFRQIRLIASNQGENDVQLILTIVDNEQSPLPVVLGSELLMPGTPPLTDSFDVPGRKLNFTATVPAKGSGTNTVTLLLLGHA
ncbi:MAG: hypothetical protein IMW89_16800 [Ktedonobacteraceae bacterium]|nr:hypothetical protein [Ktedonobacteraceae bacterium]